MAALAHILSDDGHTVQGMDTDDNLFTEKKLLEKEIFINSLSFRDFMWVDLFIIGHQFMNSEVHQYLIDHHYPWIEYHEFIAQYISKKKAVAISGTHGKTTTVGMFYQALRNFYKLSMLRGDGIGIGGINNDHMVFEACEYQRHFLVYHPETIIITNIDYDHADTYPIVEEYIEAFDQYVKNAQKIIINYEDAHKINHPHVVTYGLQKEADYACIDAIQEIDGIRGTIQAHNDAIPFFLPFYGMHNLCHALAIVAYLKENNLSIREGLKELAKFTGVKRRMVQTIINDDVFIDDYAHHPQEILATIEAVRAMHPSRKVIVFFKPDRYSRLLTFKDEFQKALETADHSFVLPLYEHLEGYHDSRVLSENEKVTFIDENDFDKQSFLDSNCVFVYMSSKRMENWIQMIVKNRESKS